MHKVKKSNLTQAASRSNRNVALDPIKTSQEVCSLVINPIDIEQESWSSKKSSLVNYSNNIKCKCKQKILIVDDNVFNLMPIKLILKEMKVDFAIIEMIKTGTPSNMSRLSIKKS